MPYSVSLDIPAISDKQRFYIKVLTTVLAAELDFLLAVKEDRVQGRQTKWENIQEHLTKAADVISVGVNLGGSLTYITEIAETLKEVINKINDVIDVTTASTEKKEDNLWASLYSIDAHKITYSLNRVGREAAYRWEYFINQVLPDYEQVRIFATVGAARIIDYLKQKDFPLTVDNALDGLSKGSSGRKGVYSFFNQRLKGREEDSALTAEGAYSESGMVDEYNNFYIHQEKVKFIKQDRKEKANWSLIRPKYGYCRVKQIEIKQMDFFKHEPHPSLKLLIEKEAKSLIINIEIIKSYLKEIEKFSLEAVPVFNKWLGAHAVFHGTIKNIDLSKGNFAEVDFSDSTFEECTLGNFQKAYLANNTWKHVTASEKILDEAVLDGSNLEKCIFKNLDLFRSSLQMTEIKTSDFSHSKDRIGLRLENARVDSYSRSTFNNNELQSILKNLEKNQNEQKELTEKKNAEILQKIREQELKLEEVKESNEEDKNKIKIIEEKLSKVNILQTTHFEFKIPNQENKKEIAISNIQALLTCGSDGRALLDRYQLALALCGFIKFNKNKLEDEAAKNLHEMITFLYNEKHFGEAKNLLLLIKELNQSDNVKKKFESLSQNLTSNKQSILLSLNKNKINWDQTLKAAEECVKWISDPSKKSSSHEMSIELDKLENFLSYYLKNIQSVFLNGHITSILEEFSTSSDFETYMKKVHSLGLALLSHESLGSLAIYFYSSLYGKLVGVRREKEYINYVLVGLLTAIRVTDVNNILQPPLGSWRENREKLKKIYENLIKFENPEKMILTSSEFVEMKHPDSEEKKQENKIVDRTPIENNIAIQQLFNQDVLKLVKICWDRAVKLAHFSKEHLCLIAVGNFSNATAVPTSVLKYKVLLFFPLKFLSDLEKNEIYRKIFKIVKFFEFQLRCLKLTNNIEIFKIDESFNPIRVKDLAQYEWHNFIDYSLDATYEQENEDRTSALLRASYIAGSRSLFSEYKELNIFLWQTLFLWHNPTKVLPWHKQQALKQLEDHRNKYIIYNLGKYNKEKNPTLFYLEALIWLIEDCGLYHGLFEPNIHHLLEALKQAGYFEPTLADTLRQALIEILPMATDICLNLDKGRPIISPPGESILKCFYSLSDLIDTEGWNYFAAKLWADLAFKEAKISSQVEVESKSTLEEYINSAFEINSMQRKYHIQPWVKQNFPQAKQHIKDGKEELLKKLLNKLPCGWKQYITALQKINLEIIWNEFNKDKKSAFIDVYEYAGVALKEYRVMLEPLLILHRLSMVENKKEEYKTIQNSYREGMDIYSAEGAFSYFKKIFIFSNQLNKLKKIIPDYLQDESITITKKILDVFSDRFLIDLKEYTENKISLYKRKWEEKLVKIIRLLLRPEQLDGLLEDSGKYRDHFVNYIKEINFSLYENYKNEVKQESENFIKLFKDTLLDKFYPKDFHNFIQNIDGNLQKFLEKRPFYQKIEKEEWIRFHMQIKEFDTSLHHSWLQLKKEKLMAQNNQKTSYVQSADSKDKLSPQPIKQNFEQKEIEKGRDETKLALEITPVTLLNEPYEKTFLEVPLSYMREEDSLNSLLFYAIQAYQEAAPEDEDRFLKIIGLLLEYGDNPWIKNKEGKDVFEFAKISFMLSKDCEDYFIPKKEQQMLIKTWKLMHLVSYYLPALNQLSRCFNKEIIEYSKGRLDVIKTPTITLTSWLNYREIATRYSDPVELDIIWLMRQLSSIKNATYFMQDGHLIASLYSLVNKKINSQCIFGFISNVEGIIQRMYNQIQNEEIILAGSLSSSNEFQESAEIKQEKISINITDLQDKEIKSIDSKNPAIEELGVSLKEKQKIISEKDEIISEKEKIISEVKQEKEKLAEENRQQREKIKELEEEKANRERSSALSPRVEYNRSRQFQPADRKEEEERERDKNTKRVDPSVK